MTPTRCSSTVAQLTSGIFRTDEFFEFCLLLATDALQLVDLCAREKKRMKKFEKKLKFRKKSEAHQKGMFP